MRSVAAVTKLPPCVGWLKKRFDRRWCDFRFGSTSIWHVCDISAIGALPDLTEASATGRSTTGPRTARMRFARLRKASSSRRWCDRRSDIGGDRVTGDRGCRREPIARSRGLLDARATSRSAHLDAVSGAPFRKSGQLCSCSIHVRLAAFCGLKPDIAPCPKVPHPDLCAAANSATIRLPITSSERARRNAWRGL